MAKSAQYLSSNQDYTTIRHLIIEGENSGPTQAWDVKEFLTKMRYKHSQESLKSN